MNKRDHLKYKGFATAAAIATKKPPPMTLPQETIEVIKSNAESYAGVMVWVNQNPKGEEQLFYEYIAATSHQAGATEWAGKAQGVADLLNQIGNDQIPTTQEELIIWIATAKHLARAALAKYKEVTNG